MSIMLAREGRNLIKEDAVYDVSEKLDGVPVFIEDGKALSRQGKPILSIQHIIDNLPLGRSFVGELYIVDAPFEYISGKVRQHTPCEELHLFLFPEFSMYIFNAPPYIHNITSRHIHGSEILALNRYSELEQIIPLIAKEPEGFIAREVGTPWEVGKRSKGYLKLLDHPTLDLKVVGIEEAIDKHGEPTGRTGKFVCKWHTGTCNVSAGKLTHDMSKEIFSHPEDFIGRIIQVKYKPSNYSTPRQPTFQHFRDDKTTYQITFGS